MKWNGSKTLHFTFYQITKWNLTIYINNKVGEHDQFPFNEFHNDQRETKLSQVAVINYDKRRITKFESSISQEIQRIDTGRDTS